MTGDLRHSLASGAWQVDVGPTYAAGRDVGASWQSAAGLVTHASRTFGIWSLTASLRGGLAWLRDGRSLWAGQTAGIAAHVGDFRFGALWQGTLVGDSSEQSTSSVFDTIPAPIDSVPFPTGGVVVRQSDVTTYRRRYRDVNDLSFATAWARGPVALQARVGRRLGFDRQSRSWWGVGGAFRLTPTVALTFNSSRTTADPLLHLRSEQSTTVGLRLAPPVHASRFQGDVPSSGIAIDRLPSGVFHLVFTLPNAEQSAAITGDLTGWKTTALLHRSDGRWEVLLPAPPGVYRINLRHDAGPWQAPPGLPATDDGFGGRVGLLVLER